MISLASSSLVAAVVVGVLLLAMAALMLRPRALPRGGGTALPT